MFTDIPSHAIDHRPAFDRRWLQWISATPANWLRLAALAVNFALWAVILSAVGALASR